MPNHKSRKEIRAKVPLSVCEREKNRIEKEDKGRREKEAKLAKIQKDKAEKAEKIAKITREKAQRLQEEAKRAASIATPSIPLITPTNAVVVQPEVTLPSDEFNDGEVDSLSMLFANELDEEKKSMNKHEEPKARRSSYSMINLTLFENSIWTQQSTQNDWSESHAIATPPAIASSSTGSFSSLFREDPTQSANVEKISSDTTNQNVMSSFSADFKMIRN